MRSKEKREAEKNEARNASANKKAAAPQPKRTSKVGVFCFAAAIFVLFSLMGTALVSLVAGLSAWACLAGACFGAIGCYSIRIANQWERVVILRLGKYNRQVGPGLYFVIPIIEFAAAHVDQRIITTPFIAEEALTAASKLTRKSKAYSTRKRTAGELPLFRLKSGILPYRLTCKTPCRKRRRPNVKETPAFCSPKLRRTSPRCSLTPLRCTTRTIRRCSCER